MITVEFLGPINKPNMELEASNLNEVAAILQKDETMREWLGSCAVAINNTLVTSLDIELKEGDKVSLLPPVCGG
jgi:sulfur-carrier protein